MKKLRVLVLIKGLGAGGAERLVCSIAEVRDRDAVDYEVAYLLPWKRTLVRPLEEAGVPVHCLAGGSEIDLGWALRLRSLLRRNRYDVLHAHSPYAAGVARLVVRTLPRANRPRLVSTEHVPWSGYEPATRALNALTFRLDDAHIAVSNAVLDSIPRSMRRRTSVVVHGIRIDQVRGNAGDRDDARRDLGAANGDVIIGTVANFRPQKAYPDLLRAARIVLTDGGRARFVAVGQGRHEPLVRSMHEELSLGDRFTLLGGRSDVERIISACDVFVLASRYEGLPIALIEALALGVPIVATAVGGTPEVVRDGIEALLVPPGRPDLLAEALSTLIRDPERRARMAQAALERSSDFDISNVARRIEAIYRSVTNGHG